MWSDASANFKTLNNIIEGSASGQHVPLKFVRTKADLLLADVGEKEVQNKLNSEFLAIMKGAGALKSRLMRQRPFLISTHNMRKGEFLFDENALVDDVKDAVFIRD